MATRPSSPRVAASNGPQQALWHDTILDAIGAAVQAAGGAKVVAGKLWPTLAPDIAAARLRSGLNPEHAQKLDPDDVLAIARLARAVGDHSIAQFYSRELCYAEPQPVEPEDQRAELQREFAASVAKLEQLAKRIAETRR